MEEENKKIVQRQIYEGWKEFIADIKDFILSCLFIFPLLFPFLGDYLFPNNIFLTWLTFVLLGLPTCIICWYFYCKSVRNKNTSGSFVTGAIGCTICFTILVFLPFCENTEKFLKDMICSLEAVSKKL